MMEDTALVSPSNKPKEHPLLAFRREWMGSNKKERDSFEFSQYREETLAYLDLLSNSGKCTCIYKPTRQIDC
jgi:hypothetical protein